MAEPTTAAGVGGITFISLVIGFVGAMLGISYVPALSKWQMFSALMAGMACAAIGPPLAALGYEHWMAAPMPAAVMNVVTFLLGLLGMYLIPGAMAIGAAFRDNPWAFIDRLRGRAPSGGGDGK